MPPPPKSNLTFWKIRADWVIACVICYNNFGVASPEGVCETPLRLPRCKHVFGNHCILKWLEESDTCPYCRDKLPSENAALSREAVRRMLQMATRSGLPLPPRTRQTFRRPMQTPRRGEPSMPDMSTQNINSSQTREGTAAGERRSLPDDLNDNQRRQRPRHEMLYSASAGSSSRPGNPLPGLPVTGPGAQQGQVPGTVTTQQYSPIRQPIPPFNLHNQPQHSQQFNDFWARRAQTLHTSQQPNLRSAPNLSHQSQIPTIGSAHGPLPIMQQAPPFSFLHHMPPVNSSGNNGTLPRGANHQNYNHPVVSSGLQYQVPAEMAPAFSGPIPPQLPAYYQQLPQLGQFQSVSYPLPNPVPELGRHDLGITGPGSYYTPN